MAPATSLAMHESFYKICDFLPPNEIPTTSSPPSTSENEPSLRTREEDAPPRSFIKRMTSRASLSALGRKHKQQSIDNGPQRKGNTEGSATADSISGEQSPRRNDAVNGRHSTNVAKPLRFNEWSVVKLLEQFDINEQIHPYQEYAYVGDYIVEVILGVSVSEESEKYQEWIKSVRERAWIDKLKDKLQPEASIGWYVVVCGDEDRFAPESTEFPTYEEGVMDNGGSQQDSRTGGLKSLFKKQTLDSRQGAPDQESPTLAKDKRVAHAESQLLHERKQSSGKSRTPLPKAS